MLYFLLNVSICVVHHHHQWLQASLWSGAVFSILSAATSVGS